eukprot:5483088-Alexandrium_andersonii.AAC.1
MSASLVGSEMCIRDSPPGTPLKSPGKYQETSQTSHKAPNKSTPTLREHPVSYTHLTLPTICSV